MSLTNRVGLLAGATTLAITGVGFGSSQHAQDETMAEIAALKAELAELRGQTGDNWLTEQRASEIRGLVQDVLADADTRSSLQGSGMTAGWDRGFFLASPDGNYRLRVQGQIQFRYAMNFRDSDDSIDSTTHGFENRRTKLNFSGNVIDRTWKYRVQGAFNRSGGDFGLEDAWIQKDFENGFYIRAGQFKPPVLREELISSGRQLAVERSLLNERFNQDFSQGVEVGWEGDWIRGQFMFHDGTGNRNTAALSSTSEWAFSARAEVLLGSTDWKQFDDFTSWSGESFGVLVGAAINWERSEFGLSGTPAGGKVAPLTLTVDAQIEFGGANLYGAFVYRDTDTEGSGSQDQIGFVIQGGVFIIPDEVELFARYEWGDPDSSAEDDLSVATVGVNWYWAKHAAKWTTDVGLSFNEVSSGWASSGANWLADAPGGDDQFVIRSQVQLLF